MAVLHARDEMDIGDRYIARSIIGSEFQCQIEAEAEVGDKPHQHMLDPDDPWPEGYRLADIWSKEE